TLPPPSSIVGVASAAGPASVLADPALPPVFVVDVPPLPPVDDPPDPAVELPPEPPVAVLPDDPAAPPAAMGVSAGVRSPHAPKSATPAARYDDAARWATADRQGRWELGKGRMAKLDVKRMGLPSGGLRSVAARRWCSRRATTAKAHGSRGKCA